jgi:peroxidase
MAPLNCSRLTMMSLAFFVLLIVGSANAQLSTNFYSSSCPKLSSTVQSTVKSAITKEARIGASILHLFFHDCFVNVRLIYGLRLYIYFLKHLFILIF